MQILRKCTICGIEANNFDELKLFVKESKSSFGHQNTCKNCRNKRSLLPNREYTKQKIKVDPQYFSKRVNSWRERNPEKYKILKKRCNKNYKETHPERVIAHTQSKRVKKQDFCSLCGVNYSLEKHHPDYSKPKEVITLCHNCHLKIHGRLHV